MILPYVCVFFFFKEKERKKKKEREINIDPEDFPRFAVFDTRLPEHAIRSSTPVLCLFVSLQGQLANDDSDDEEEDAQRQHAGAQALFPHGRAHQGGGVRGGHGGHLSLPQSVVLLRGEQEEEEEEKKTKNEKLSVLRDSGRRRTLVTIKSLVRLCCSAGRQNNYVAGGSHAYIR